MMDHLDTAPLALILATPDERSGRYIVAISIHIGPYLYRFADDALYREPRTINARINTFDVEGVSR
jgi:hypothetical protein